MGFLIIFADILLLLIYFNARVDKYIIDVKRRSFTKWQYAVKTFIRAAIMTLNAMLLLSRTGNINIVDVGILVALQSSLFWILFDICLNLLRHLKWYYVGKTANSDEMFESKEWLQFFMKFLYLSISVVLTIIRFT